MGEDEDYYSLRSACTRCHAQKLRCTRERGQLHCVRCLRSNVNCVPRPSRRTALGRSLAQSDQIRGPPSAARSGRPVGTSPGVAPARDPVLDWNVGVVELSSYPSASASTGGISDQYHDLMADSITAVNGEHSSLLSALTLSAVDPGHTHSPTGSSSHHREMGTDPEERTNDLASLNSQIYNHRKSMADSIRAFQGLCGTLHATEQQRASHPNTHQGGHRLPVDETLLLALRLLNLLGHGGHDIGADPAASLLVLSCYTGLITTLCDLLARLGDLLTRVRDSQGPLSPLSIVNLMLPAVDIGGLSLHVGIAPRLRALLVLDMGEHLMHDVAEQIVTALGNKSSAGLDGGSGAQDEASAGVFNTTLRVVRDQQAVFSRSLSKMRDIL